MQTIVTFCMKAYYFMLPVAWIGLTIVILILFPLAIFRRTRGFAGACIYFFSWIVGITTWFLGAAAAFFAWSWWGLIIGIILFGVGVVPVGILAAFFSLKITSMGVSLIVMSLITYVFRLIGISFMASTEDSP